MQDVTGTKGDVQYRYRLNRAPGGCVYLVRDTWLRTKLVACQVAALDPDSDCGQVSAWIDVDEGFSYEVVPPTLAAEGTSAEKIADIVGRRIEKMWTDTDKGRVKFFAEGWDRARA